jgi:hypothetical protein
MHLALFRCSLGYLNSTSSSIPSVSGFDNTSEARLNVNGTMLVHTCRSGPQKFSSFLAPKKRGIFGVTRRSTPVEGKNGCV